MYPLSNACGQLGQSYQVSFIDMKTLAEGSCTKIAVENTNSSQQPRVNSRASFSLFSYVPKRCILFVHRTIIAVRRKSTWSARLTPR